VDSLPRGVPVHDLCHVGQAVRLITALLMPLPLPLGLILIRRTSLA
jgi:hypothetical protein